MRKVLTIYGPTATGKTALALQLAKKFQGEIISADSRQVYKGLDIGTGKLPIERLNDSTIKRFRDLWIVDGIKIHGFDLVEPGQNFSVADFLDNTSTSLFRIGEVKNLPIIVGGTGFYIKALLDGIDSIGTPADRELRTRLEKLSKDELYQKLLQLDPYRAKSLNESDRQNPRRLIRAIEIAISYQRPEIRDQKSLTYHPTILPSPYLLLGLTAPNPYLYAKADQSFQNRIAHGMLEEIKFLLKRGVDPKWLDSLGIEYRWLTQYVLGKIPKEEAFERSKGELHSFIRHQKSWFKQFETILLFDISKPGWSHQLEKTVKDWYDT